MRNIPSVTVEQMRKVDRLMVEEIGVSILMMMENGSGLDGNTEEPHIPTIKAATTLTLALPKVGLLTEKAKEYVGQLYVADLSVPKNVYNKLGISIPVLFEDQEVVKVL